MESERIRKIVAERMTAYRKQANLTQAELAEKINYSSSFRRNLYSAFRKGRFLSNIEFESRRISLWRKACNNRISDISSIRNK